MTMTLWDNINFLLPLVIAVIVFAIKVVAVVIREKGIKMRLR